VLLLPEGVDEGEVDNGRILLVIDRVGFLCSDAFFDGTVNAICVWLETAAFSF
jgi:hypothetical protein